MKHFKVLLILIFILSADLNAQDVDHLDVYSESMLYISGDLIRLQIVPAGKNGGTVPGKHLVHAYLISHDGKIIDDERFLITEYDKSGAIFLPEDIETGVFKLIAFVPGVENQTEVTIYIYNPSIFSSSVAPENADLSAGLPQVQAITAPTVPVEQKNPSLQFEMKSIDPAQSVPGIGMLKVYHKKMDTPPVRGVVVAAPRREDSGIDFDFELATDHPNSRLSFYFLDQAMVEEYYLADEGLMLKGLREHYGSGPVYAYQFDRDGSRMGEIRMTINKRNQPVFQSFENIVPFNTEIQDVLENKRIRKFVDQVYRNQNDRVVSIQEEEFDRSPDSSTYPDRYEGIATLREMLASIVPKSQVIRRNSIYEARLSPANSGFRYTESPLVLINGVPTFELDSLMETPIQDVEVIETFNSLERLRRFGTLGRFGVISIKLRSEVDNPLAEKRDQLPVIPGISDLIRDESVKNQVDTPDLRSVLLWDPSFRFYPDQPARILLNNSDLNGEYQIFGELIMPDGSRKFISDSFILGKVK
ncbi:hypothetical protein [Fulvivirga sedimenti]|uniref:TonB-dependent receptor plug domain-containing protein n=1 Tax=Fulvivirga sedimenti TaxID=2879465 RepID=A0A9X1L1G8_9BACT|nr:hypothetical protein [Fulvivirga sedimenti]MCA6078212.1 hypothetical protein [Fulvivirga sedimenti]